MAEPAASSVPTVRPPRRGAEASPHDRASGGGDGAAESRGLAWLGRRWWWVAAAVGLIYAGAWTGDWRITADGALHAEAARVGGASDPAAATVLEDPAALRRIRPGLAWVWSVVGPPTLGVDDAGTPRLAAAAGVGVMLALAGLGLTLSYRLVLEHQRTRGRPGRGVAAAVLLGLGVNQLWLDNALSVLTELPFAVGLLLFAWGQLRWEESGRALWGHDHPMQSRERVLAAAMLLGGAAVMFWFRSVAVVVVGAWVVSEATGWASRWRQRRSDGRVTKNTPEGRARDRSGPMSRGRSRGAGWWKVAGWGVAGLALWWGVTRPAVQADAWLLWSAVADLDPGRWGHNAWRLIDETLPEAVFGQDVSPYASWAASGAVLAAAVGLSWERRFWGVLLAVMVLQWLVFLNDARYVLPVLPLMVLGLVRLGQRAVAWHGTGGQRPGQPSGAGTSRRMGWRPPGGWRLAGVRAVGVAWLGANLVGVAQLLAEQRAAVPLEAYRGGTYRPVAEAAIWLQQATPPDTVVELERRVRLELAYLARRRVVSPAGPAEGPGRLRVHVDDIGEAGDSASAASAASAVWRTRDPATGESWWVEARAGVGVEGDWPGPSRVEGAQRVAD